MTTMLQRYDHRLAEFAQALNDALNQTLPARITARDLRSADRVVRRGGGAGPFNVVRVLELAREQTSADAAVAIVGTKQEPILATVGLSQSARSHRSAGSGVARLPGARAIQVSFNGDDAPHGGDHIGAGRFAAASRSRFSTRRRSPACSRC